jgi:Leucine-rich repeat (LRR) protein
MCCAWEPVKGNMLILLALLLLSYGSGNSRCSTVPNNSLDMLSLLDFKKSISVDPGQVLSNWTASTPYCQWTGVRCSRTHTDRVVELDLADHGLTGTLTPSLGNLTFLRILNFSSNHFSGYLPHLNYLHQLEVLDLSKNSLQGTIPDTLTNCSNLKKLVLYNNLLEGKIPPKVGFLSKLALLNLAENNLTGSIPPTLNNTQLKKIGLPDNQLTGSVPHELGYLSNLSFLFLDGNMLSGGFPAFLLNMPTLKRLDLGSNLLGGKLPPNIGDTFPNLGYLSLSFNNFEGQIPSSLGNAQSLELLDLSSNNFTGQVPRSFSRLSQLNKLNLQDNMLETANNQSWEFLYGLRNCRNLSLLSLAGNQLSGTIPEYIGDLSTELTQLFLDHNNLSGIAPSSIGNLTGLTKLGLSANNLTGTLGEWIGMLKYLQQIELQQNNFIGPIPSSIGNLTLLTILYLDHNEFTGTIPTSFAHLQQLTDLELSYNNLFGNLPSEVFSIPTLTICELSNNKLEGQIPLEVGHLAQLTELYLSSNKLSGEIPSTLSQCQELNILKLDQNYLTGSIPMSIANLTSLTVLNLSHNNLSGLIPAAIGGIKTFTCLDLSYNRLQGEIPSSGVFANATAVALNGNLGLCGGSLDLHMPPCASISPRSKRTYYLIRVLIPIFGFLSLALLIYFVTIEKKMSRAYSLFPYFGDKFPKVSYIDLAQATGSFSNLIGTGSYGSVYKGKLIPSKLEVAVKILNLDIHGAEKSFLAECEALRGIRHRNLLPIITACSTVDNNGSPFKALVYPFMPNGNLDAWLHHNEEEKDRRLSLTQRINIAANIADALDYLHHDIGRAIIHCDLKPSNILLDEDMTALLGDFGIASFYIDSASTSIEDPNTTSSRCISSIGVKGTIGYIAPGIITVS